MTDDKFTADLQDWINAEPEQRDLSVGADLLLRLTGMQVRDAKIRRNLPAFASFIEAELKKHLKFRLERMTHRQLVEMEAKAEEAVKRHFDSLPPDPGSPPRRGKRPDHERLPAEIRELFDRNMDDRRLMAECHLQLRKLSGSNSSCPDSDRFPFVKELIRLDKLCLERWRRYDDYKPA